MMTLKANEIKRLNVLLKLPRVNVISLGKPAWKKFLDDLYFAVFGEGRIAGNNYFHTAATRDRVRAALEGLHGHLQTLIKPTWFPATPNDLLPDFLLAAQEMYIIPDKEGFYVRYATKDFPTMVYQALGYLLEKSKIKKEDILVCANDGCKSLFIPLRKPHKGKQSFCSQECGNLIAARKWRRNKAEELRVKEKERSRRRYEKKVHLKHPTAPVGRHPRKH
jgi:hypothetical protein